MSTVLHEPLIATLGRDAESQRKPQYPGIPTTSDGAGMVVWVETHITQGACAYPITSSTTMGGGYQVEVANGTRNLAVQGMFVFIGFRPNTGIIDGHFDHDEMGYIRTDTTMQTSIPGLFAAGDLRSQLTRQVTTAVGDATTAAIAVEKYLKARSEGGHAFEAAGSGGYAV